MNESRASSKSVASAMTGGEQTSNTRSPRDIAREVLEIESRAIEGVIEQLDESFDRAVELLGGCTGRVVCTGMGKSGLVMKKVAATLSSTGTPALFLHPAEALHGDLGMIVEGDVVLAASYSGTTEELRRLTETLRRLGVPLVMLTGNRESPLAQLADLHLAVAIDQEACPLNLAPTASSTATLSLGDALAMAIADAKGFSQDDFALLHPGGRLGRRLLRVEQLMKTGDELPVVGLATPMPDAIYEMSRKKLGITAVVDDQAALVGCISDGDLRRLLQEERTRALEKTAADCMVEHPKTIAKDELASAALHEMEEHRITSIFVCAPKGALEGIVHLHDLWRLDLF